MNYHEILTILAFICVMGDIGVKLYDYFKNKK